MVVLAIKIFIDQGHNPRNINAGAEGFGLREQDITYNVGKFLAELLNQDSRFEVRTSRNSPDDYFLSIHANANTNPDINGTEMYVYKENSQAYFLAEHILENITNILKTKDNGVRVRPSLYVLKNTNMPAVLIELAYITNQRDSEKLRDNQREFARGIYDGLLNYFGFLN